jgi:hypothetical protein
MEKRQRDKPAVSVALRESIGSVSVAVGESRQSRGRIFALGQIRSCRHVTLVGCHLRSINHRARALSVAVVSIAALVIMLIAALPAILLVPSAY